MSGHNPVARAGRCGTRLAGAKCTRLAGAKCTWLAGAKCTRLAGAKCTHACQCAEGLVEGSVGVASESPSVSSYSVSADG